MRERKKCPRCGFYMTENYCIRCGYTEGNTVRDTKKYDYDRTLEELALGDNYQEVLHGENGIKLFIMGPLYFCYRNFLVMGTLLFGLDIFIRYRISTADIPSLSNILGYSLPQDPAIVIYFWVMIRIFYVILGDAILLKVSKFKGMVFKKIFPDSYQKYLGKGLNKICSLGMVIIYFIGECLLWYYVF